MIEFNDCALPHGITLSCRCTGIRGRPVLMFLHGFPEAAFVWDGLLEHFARPENGGFRCIAPNLRGYGPSSAPAEVANYRPKHLMQDIAALIEHEGGPLACLVAHDWGGAVAWNLAASAPGCMEKLAIINSPHPGTFLRELQHSPAQQAASAYMNFLIRPDAEALLAEDDFRRMWEFFTAMGAADGPLLLRASLPYAIPNVRIENPAATAHARIGWLRSVNNIQHAFAAQSFIAEIAHAQGKDHRDYLLEMLGPDRLIDPVALGEPWNHGESPTRYPVNTGRLRAVVERVTQEAGWGRKLAKGHGLGLAAHYSFVTYVAAVIEVAIDAKGQLTIPRIDVAVDCGPQVNPDRIRSQMEGACVMGISQALFSEVTFKNGRVQQDNFHQFEIARLTASPKKIVVHLMPSSGYDTPLGGIGEPGVPVIAPALVNAIQAAVGKRIRALPLGNQLTA